MTNPGFCFFFSFHKNLGCLQKTRKTFHFFLTKRRHKRKKCLRAGRDFSRRRRRRRRVKQPVVVVMSSVAFTVRDVSSREEAEVLSFLLLSRRRRRLKSNAKNKNNSNSNGIRGEGRQTGVCKKGDEEPDGLVFSVVTVASMIAREGRKRCSCRRFLLRRLPPTLLGANSKRARKNLPKLVRLQNF